MSNYKNIAVVFVLTGALASFPAVARAQAEEVVATPIIAKAVEAVAPKKDPPGSLWLRAQVIRADSRTLIVQEEANPKMIHTFTYSPRLKTFMQDLQNSNGGYRYGDRIKILYQQAEPGQFVALRIKGKPS